MNSYQAFALVALVSAAGSLFIVIAAVYNLRQITDSGMWAIAAMAAGPAAMGIGVSYFVARAASVGSWIPEGKKSKESDLN